MRHWIAAKFYRLTGWAHAKAALWLSWEQARGFTEETFLCAGCKQYVPASEGGSDDMPEHCADCWMKAHETP